MLGAPFKSSWRFDDERFVEVGVGVVHEVAAGTHLGAAHEVAAVDPCPVPDRSVLEVDEERQHGHLDLVEALCPEAVSSDPAGVVPDVDRNAQAGSRLVDLPVVAGSAAGAADVTDAVRLPGDAAAVAVVDDAVETVRRLDGPLGTDRLVGGSQTLLTGDSALLVSENGGESWEERGEERVLDLAVDPDDAEHILATSPVSSGELSVIRSRDGARSWEDAAGVPSLARVAWGTDGALLAVGPEGGVWTSEDGRSWRERSAVPGFPETLLVSAEGVYVAAGGALLASADGGDTWELILRYP